MFTFHIAYRVDPARTETAERQVRLAFDRVHQLTHIAGRLLKSANDQDHWLEIYEQVADPDAFLQGLAQVTQQFGLESFLAHGFERRVECLMD